MYGGAKKTKKTKKKSKKGNKLNLDKLATSTLLVSSAVASLSKGQQKTLKQKIKQKRTKIKKEMKKKVHKDKSGKKRIRSGSIGDFINDILNSDPEAEGSHSATGECLSMDGC